MIGYVLTKGFTVRAVVAEPIPGRPMHVRVGKKVHPKTAIHEKASQALAEGVNLLARLEAMHVRRAADLAVKAGHLERARMRLRQGD